MNELTWTCHVCHERRPDNCISVFTKDISGGYDLKPGTVKENIRYCNDRPACIERAKEFSFFEGGRDGVRTSPRDSRPGN